MTTELIQFKTEMMESFQADMEIRTWGDFARRFLLGNGNSPNTTRTYLTACKQFYEFTGRLHPMQAGKDPAWIEQFYDQMPPDLDTRAARVAGLKYMYRRICEKYGMYPNPFDKMSDALKAKLKRTKKDESERGALTEAEYTGLLRMLKNEVSLKAIQSYALVRFAVTSGMRAAELSGLRWENISDIDGEHRATFIGKGNKLRTIQLEKQAVAAIRRSFRMRWGRKPSPGDKVFHGLPTGPGLTPGMSSGGIYYRVQTIITEAKATGIIRANLHVSPHTFRHTCATRLLAAGVDIRTVQQHLGHSNLATTMVYLDERQDLTGAWTQIHGDEV